MRRRPLEAYLQILKLHGLRLIDQEPVFAILGDPVPDGRGRGRALFLIWRVLQKSIRMVPEGLRNAYGTTLVRVLYPLDRFIRAMTDIGRINLELALFVRDA